MSSAWTAMKAIQQHTARAVAKSIRSARAGNIMAAASVVSKNGTATINDNTEFNARRLCTAAIATAPSRSTTTAAATGAPLRFRSIASNYNQFAVRRFAVENITRVNINEDKKSIKLENIFDPIPRDVPNPATADTTTSIVADDKVDNDATAQQQPQLQQQQHHHAGNSRNFMRLINGEEMKLLNREKSTLQELRTILADWATEEDKDFINKCLKQLEELFLVVIVGEFNSGKSSFINALLGDRYLKTGVTPTTNSLHIIRYGGNVKEEHDEHNDRVFVNLPLSWLQDLNVVDTPGTNAIIKKHQEITEHFVPRSDLILFITSVERPFSESEHYFLERIKSWGKKVVLVINKTDMLDAKQLEEVEQFVRDGIIKTLGMEPKIFPVSARRAIEAKLAEKDTLGVQKKEQHESWEKSGFEALESFVFDTLDSTERIKLKLQSPLGVADVICNNYKERVAQRLAVLKEDNATIDIIQQQLDAYKADMVRDFELQKSRVENVLFRLAERGDKFFDNFLTLSNVRTLMDKNAVKEQFERAVVSDTVRQLEQHVSELVDWMIERKYKQWKAVTDFAYKRAKISTSEEKLVGSLKSDFDFNRQNLLLTLGRESEQVMSSFNKEAEVNKLNEEISTAIFQTAAVGMSAIGLGAAAMYLMPTAMLDFVGIFSASAVAATSLYILPYKRHRLKKQFRENINSLRESLGARLHSQFLRDLDESTEAILNAIAPYSRFVRVETKNYQDLRTQLDKISDEIESLRKAIDAMEDNNHANK